MNDKTMAVRTPAHDLDEVRKLVTAGLRGYRARIYLFGSWAIGDAGRASDIDVAVLPLEPIPRHVFSEIREALEESCVLYPVDLVDISDSSEEFRTRVVREGVLWQD
jgi:predicted nucleotidyltransferase